MTLVYILENDWILLGLRKRGMAKVYGMDLDFGGKIEPDESKIQGTYISLLSKLNIMLIRCHYLEFHYLFFTIIFKASDFPLGKVNSSQDFSRIPVRKADDFA